jgi:hypothetical protein
VAGVYQDKSRLHGGTVKMSQLSLPASPGCALLFHHTGARLSGRLRNKIYDTK